MGPTLLAAGLAAAWPCHARADDAERRRCVASYESAQEARLEGRLLEARAGLRACNAESCPEIVRRDCSEWLHEVESALPTVIVSARSGSGADLADVRVLVDGRLAADRLTGRPIAIDPGEHELVCEHRGAAPQVQRVIVNAGEKNRLLRVVFADSSTDASAPALAPRTSADPPWLAIALAGVGAVALGVGTGIDLVAASDLADLRDGCAPGCQQREVDDIRTRMAVGDVLLATGVVALGVSVVLWATRGTDQAPRAAQRAPSAPWRLVF